MNHESPQELISVVIPTYNRAHCIERAIRSVLDQTYSELELLIIDDGSTDDTEKVVKAIQDDRLQYICLKKNSGACMARNVGVQYAKGDIIAFQDSDDCWYADKLEKQMGYWAEHPECNMIYSAYMLKRGNGKDVRVPYAETWGNLEGNIFNTLLVNNTVGTPTILFRKASFLDAGGFDERMECLEDWDFAIRFAEKNRIGYVEEVLMDAYLMEGGISSHIGNFCLNRCRMIVKYRKPLLERGLFDRVTLDLLNKAKSWGILEQVQAMLVSMLKDK